jgi:DNA primase
VRFPPVILDEIRARLPVSAVVGKRVRMKKAGREWKGLSPFNAEKTPSFYVNDQKGFYHCFSSGKHGDIFTFLMETEGLSFPEAVERLAADAGVPLPKASPELEQVIEKRRDLYDVLELACRFFEAQLMRPNGAEARAYLDRRGVSASTQAEFRLGFASDSRTALLEHLRGKGIKDDLIVRAGLAIEPEGGRGLYDRFRGRIIFPIQDLRARVVAFGGRALGPDVKPKYLNSPETEVFHKGQIVFNGHRAREEAHRTQSIVVVEGYLDAIAVYQAGRKSVVATLGTAFTEEQIEALWRLAPEPVLCFDGDNAGKAAAFRAVDRMLPLVKVGKSFRFAFLPQGQDPDDLIRTSGISSFEKHLDASLKFWDVLWRRESETIDPTNPDEIARLDQNLRRLISQIVDTQLRYRYELSSKLHVNELAWRGTRRRFEEPVGGVSSIALLRSSRIFSGEPTRLTRIERIFLGLCVEFPDFAAQACDRIAAVTFRGHHKLSTGEQSYQAFASALMDLIIEEHTPDAASIYQRINPVFYEMLDFLHGREAPGQPLGYRLRQQFPVLSYVHDETYFSRCFWNFLNMLIVREMEDELTSKAETEEIAEAERWFELQSHIHLLRDQITAEENELADLASIYRPKRAA